MKSMEIMKIKRAMKKVLEEMEGDEKAVKLGLNVIDIEEW